VKIISQQLLCQPQSIEVILLLLTVSSLQYFHAVGHPSSGPTKHVDNPLGLSLLPYSLWEHWLPAKTPAKVPWRSSHILACHHSLPNTSSCSLSWLYTLLAAGQVLLQPFPDLLVTRHPQDRARMSTGQAITTSAQVCAACRGASTATAGSQRARGHAEGPGSCQGAGEGHQDEPPQAAAHHRCPAGPALQGLCPQGLTFSLLLDVTQQVFPLPALLLLSLPIQILTVSSVQRTFIFCPFAAVQP